MKRVCFIVGQNYSNIYESCKNLISNNYLNDILLFDLDKTLERVHYKRKINISYDTFYNNLTDLEKYCIFERTIEERLKENFEIEDIMITGLLDYNEIERIIIRNNIMNFNIILVDTTKELSYRNYSYELKRNISIDEFDKIYNEDKKTLDNLKSLLSKSNYDFSIYYRRNNNDDLEDYIANYFEIKTCSIRKEECYQWPVVPQYRLIEHDKYGIRPVHMILGKPKFHSGFDITCKTNTEVCASISGVVTNVGFDERIFSGESKWNQRYGNKIEILDNYGRKQIYAHLRKIFVRKGELVNSGDIIALSGCSGGARVPHLHFEIRKFNTDHSGVNNTIDPLILLPEYEFNNKEFDEAPYDEIWKEMCISDSITDESIGYAKSKKYIR